MSDKESIKDVFEKWAGGWTASSMERGHPIPHKWWLKELDLAEDSKVLDVGCGTGWASRMIARMFPKRRQNGFIYLQVENACC